MDDANRKILKSIRRTRDRMHNSKILDITLKSLFVALCVYLVLAILSRFLPIYNPYFKGAIIVALISAIGFIASLFMPPKNKAAALLLDDRGLSERVITAYELINDESTMALIQKNDAVKHLDSINIKKEIRIVLPKKIIALCLIIMSLVLLSAFIPNPMESKATELHNVKKKIENQEKEIEEVIKKVEANEKLNSVQKEEALEILRELKKDISKEKDLNDALKAMQRTENKLSMMKQKYDSKDTEKIIDAFSKNESTKSLADALKSGEYKKLKKEISDTTKALQNLDEESTRELLESLVELSKTLMENPDLALAIINLAEKIADGELGGLENDLKALGDELDKLMQIEEFKMAMDDIINQLNCSDCQNPGNQGQNQGQSSGGNKSGSGGGSGSGSGAGSGSSSGSESVNQGGGSGLGKKESTGGEIKEYEKIFATDLLGGEGDKDILSGQKNQDGQVKVFKTEQGITVKGEMLPYDQVFGRYKEQAFKNIESNQIPQGMQEIVKEYFSSLEK